MSTTLQRWAVSSADLTTASGLARALTRLANLIGRTPIYGASRLATAATTIVDSDDLLLVDATTAPVTVTLPPAGQNLGRRFTVKKTDATANAVTLDGDGAELIDGAATQAWTTQWQAMTVQACIITAPNTAGWMTL